MSSGDIDLPKSAVAAATMIIILHWSGATFVGGASASTWLGAVQIERGWMIGVFLHIWFFASFFLQWQKEGANKFSQYESWNAELWHHYLLRENPEFVIFLKQALSNNTILPNDDVAKSSNTLIDEFRSGGYEAKRANSNIRLLPTIKRSASLNYTIDFSKPSFISGRSNQADRGLTRLDQFPNIPIHNIYNLKMLGFELTSTLYILTHKLDWYKRFLHWALGYFACLSIILTKFGML